MSAALVQVQVEKVLWEEHRTFDADITLGADLLYDPREDALLQKLSPTCLQKRALQRSPCVVCLGAFKDLVLTLKATLAAMPAHPGTAPRSAYLATTRRNEATFSAFLALLAPAQLEMTALQPDAVSGGANIRFMHHLALQSTRDSITLRHVDARRL